MSEAGGVVGVPVDEWESMKARLAELESLTTHLAEARPAAASPSGAGVPELGEAVTDRRRVLRRGALLAAGAVAGSAALMVNQAGPAAAASGDLMVLGTSMDAGTGSTDIASAASIATLSAENSGTSGSALRASVLGGSSPYPVVYGYGNGLAQAFHGLITNNATNTQPCILAENNNSHGQAVLGTLGGQPNSSAAVEGSNITLGAGPGVSGTSIVGNGVEGRITDPANVHSSVYGLSFGLGQAFHGLITNNATNTQPCILAENNNPHGQAVLGTLGGQPNSSAAVEGSNDTLGAGPGVSGTSVAGNGVEGRATTNGFGAGVYGSAVSAFSSGVRGDCGRGNGLYGSTKSGAGVKGAATTGRGGLFSGQAAQISLVPATASTHPTSGKSGDLFLDGSARLWLCTVGGTTATWKQVQVA